MSSLFVYLFSPPHLLQARTESPLSRAETPPLPWFRRQKSLDSQRLAEQAAIVSRLKDEGSQFYRPDTNWHAFPTQESIDIDAILLDLLPDCTSTHGTTGWMQRLEVRDATLSQVRES